MWPALVLLSLLPFDSRRARIRERTQVGIAPPLEQRPLHRPALRPRRPGPLSAPSCCGTDSRACWPRGHSGCSGWAHTGVPKGLTEESGPLRLHPPHSKPPALWGNHRVYSRPSWRRAHGLRYHSRALSCGEFQLSAPGRVQRTEPGIFCTLFRPRLGAEVDRPLLSATPSSSRGAVHVPGSVLISRLWASELRAPPPRRDGQARHWPEAAVSRCLRVFLTA